MVTKFENTLQQILDCISGKANYMGIPMISMKMRITPMTFIVILKVSSGWKSKSLGLSFYFTKLILELTIYRSIYFIFSKLRSQGLSSLHLSTRQILAFWSQAYSPGYLPQSILMIDRRRCFRSTFVLVGPMFFFMKVGRNPSWVSNIGFGSQG